MITRYDIWGPDWDSDESDDGDWTRYEDHLMEVAKLEHIISGCEQEIHRQAQEISKLKYEIAYGLPDREPKENARMEGADFIDHTQE